MRTRLLAKQGVDAPAPVAEPDVHAGCFQCLDHGQRVVSVHHHQASIGVERIWTWAPPFGSAHGAERDEVTLPVPLKVAGVPGEWHSVVQLLNAVSAADALSELRNGDSSASVCILIVSGGVGAA